MNLEIGPGSVWVVRDRRQSGFRTVVLLIDEVTTNAGGKPYTGEPAWNGVVLLDVATSDFEGRIVSFTRPHLFNVFERLL